MAKAIALRADHGAADLRRLARASRDAAQARRLLALAAIQDGASRTEAARIGGVGLQIVRDWVLRFNAEGSGGPCGSQGAGPAAAADARAARRARAERWEAGPKSETCTASCAGGSLTWRGGCGDEFGVSLSRQTLGRELRPHGVLQALRAPAGSRAGPRGHRGVQKNLPAELGAIRAKLPPETPIELWWQDEARVGQKNAITRRWARRGAARGRGRRTTSARSEPTSSVRSAQPKGRRRVW